MSVLNTIRVDAAGDLGRIVDVIRGRLSDLREVALDHERGPVHDYRQSDHDQLHGHWGDERYYVLLRGLGGEHGGGKCQFQPGECDTHGEHNGDQLQQRVHLYRIAVEWEYEAEWDAAAVDRWGDK